MKVCIAFCVLLMNCLSETRGQDFDDWNMTLIDSFDDTFDRSNCSVSFYDEGDETFYLDEISKYAEEQVKVVKIEITFDDDDIEDPLDVGNQKAYDLNVWGKAITPQGMPIVDLLFHFDLTELTSWTLAIRTFTLRLKDEPQNCVASLSEEEKTSKLLEVLSPEGGMKYYRLCHKIVLQEGTSNIARFSTKCCYYMMEVILLCDDEEPQNYWLVLLGQLLIAVRFLVLFFGPFLLSKNLQNEKFHNFNYYIIPKIRERVVLYHQRYEDHVKEVHKNKHIIKINSSDENYNFQCFRNLVARNGLGQKKKPCIVDVTKYKISVNHKWLIPETDVPVGLWRRFADTVAQRGVRKLPPVEPPTRLKLYKRLLGQVMLLISVSIPYCIRVAIFYEVEKPKIDARTDAAKNLVVPYNWNLISYLNPLHMVWIILYINHIVTTAMTVTSPDLCTFRLATQIRNVSHHSLAGLEYLDRQHGIRTMIKFLTWPCKHYGCSALIFAPLWLVFALPFVTIVFLLYMVPLFYLCMRIIIGIPIWRFENKEEKSEEKCKPPEDPESFNGVIFDVFNLFRVIHIPEECSAYYDDQNVDDRQNYLDMVANVAAKIMVFFGLVAAMLIFAECVGFLVDLMVLLLIGIIANAKTHFKYVSIVILILFYTWDVIRDVKKVYLKLNSAIFTDTEKQIPELQRILNLPSNIQQNTAFVVDIDDQDTQRNFAFKEDKLQIKQLALFVDNHDTPRIPIELFEEMAKVEIVGTPGSILKNYMRAFIQLAAILLFLLFIILIILAIGQDYFASGTSLFATVIGGLLPMFLRVAFKPKAAEVQLGSLTFIGKLNERISKLEQEWPLVDIEFEVCDDQEQDISLDQYDVLIIDDGSHKLNLHEEC